MKAVYVIAHRTNDLKDINNALQQGVNALELDVRYGRMLGGLTDLLGLGKHDWYVEHDFVNFTSSLLTTWLQHLRSLLSSHPRYQHQLALLIFDIKTVENLVLLRNLVRANIPNNISVIFSIGNFAERFSILPLFNDTRPNEGFAIDYDASPADVKNFFSDQSINNYWYGDGMAAGFIEPSRVESNIRKAIELRSMLSAFKGVYTWTYANSTRIEFYLKLGIDGIMVNIAGNGQTLGNGLSDALAIIKKLPHKRLATSADTAFGSLTSPNAPTIIKTHYLTGSIYLYALDHERIGANEHGNKMQFINQALNQVGINVPISIDPLTVGGEIRVELYVHASILDLQGTLKVSGNLLLFEGDSVRSSDLDGQQLFSFLLASGATHTSTIRVNNNEGGDWAEARFNLINSTLF